MTTNRRNFGLGIVACLLFQTLVAQSNLLNAETPADIGMKTDAQERVDDDKPLAYGYLDDRDILWSKIVWEYIDLNERFNLPLYYPADTVNIANTRRSLFDTLLKGIRKGEITELYDDSYFNQKMTRPDIEMKLQRVDTTDAGIDELNAGETNIDEYIDRINITSQDIKGYKIKGIWYFDKRQSELRYRLLAIAPVAPDVQTMGREEMDLSEQLALFWVWYPDARETLHRMKVFNPKNSSYPISFDHLMNARRFHALIYKEENTYEDREIRSYIKDNALFQVLESNRIKEEIRNREHDMWNY
ncbi:MAG: gliding motility protein GldN [Lutibacter sp.]|jgi:gliding motility associated protien GldN|nr:gliding motility protein GldN [Lutibacter sp.]